MKLGIMQPYYFPYLGYFDLINCADHWVVFDTAQYIRHGWINRNRILHPTKGSQYVVVPVRKHARETPIRDVRIAEDDAWKRRIPGQIQHYKKKARRHFERVHDLIEACHDTDETSISRFNVSILARVCRVLDIPFEYSFFSELDLDLGPIEHPGDWALRISEAMGASEYFNPPGGEHLFDKAAFERAGIRLTIRHLPPLEYDCYGYEFIPNLSILDVLLWNSPSAVKQHLDRHLP